MWQSLKSINFQSFIQTILNVLSFFPPTFLIVISAGLIILCALGIKRVLF